MLTRWKYSRQNKSTPGPSIHPTFVQVNRLKCSYGSPFTETLDGKNAISRYPSQPALSTFEHIINFTKYLVIRYRNSETGKPCKPGSCEEVLLEMRGLRTLAKLSVPLNLIPTRLGNGNWITLWVTSRGYPTISFSLVFIHYFFFVSLSY